MYDTPKATTTSQLLLSMISHASNLFRFWPPSDFSFWFGCPHVVDLYHPVYRALTLACSLCVFFCSRKLTYALSTRMGTWCPVPVERQANKIGSGIRRCLLVNVKQIVVDNFASEIIELPDFFSCAQCPGDLSIKPKDFDYAYGCVQLPPTVIFITDPQTWALIRIGYVARYCCISTPYVLPMHSG